MIVLRKDKNRRLLSIEGVFKTYFEKSFRDSCQCKLFPIISLWMCWGM